MYEVCERLGVWYTFGFTMYPGLKQASDALLATAVDQFGTTREKQRLFMVMPYRADRWNQSRTVVIKVECHEAGTNRRAVVTNRAGAMIVPQGVYDDDTQRGESDRRRRIEGGRAARNKELKIDLCGGRLSDHRFMANLFRLYLHTLALNLLIRLRSLLPKPEADGPRRDGPVPDRESTTEPDGRELHHAQPATWRLRIIKVAAEVIVSARRIVIRLSSAWPGLPTWRNVLLCVQRQ